MIPPHATTTHHHNQYRLFSTTPARPLNNDEDDGTNANTNTNTPSPPPRLTHVTASGTAHMVSITDKLPTRRVAQAQCAVRFSSPTALTLIRANQLRKGDVLGVARVAGLMAAKRTPDLIPLCHPVMLTHAEVELVLSEGGEVEGGEGGKGRGDRGGGCGDEVRITATVSCDGKTGVEMEALTAASAAALTVYDMCKAVDKGMVIGDLRVVLKEGGKSGRWVEGEKVE